MSDFSLYIEKNTSDYFQDPILYQEVSLNINKYTNEELLYYRYFWEQTNTPLLSIIILNKFIFFFINGEYYAEVIEFKYQFRRKIKNRKIQFIFIEDTLLKLIYRFFPDIFIYDLIVIDDAPIPEIYLTVLSYRERGIAIGRRGDYIKTVNKIFENNVNFTEQPVKIKCEVVGFLQFNY